MNIYYNIITSSTIYTVNGEDKKNLKSKIYIGIKHHQQQH